MIVTAGAGILGDAGGGEIDLILEGEMLRAELAIEAVKEVPWSWAENPAIGAALAAA